MVALRDIVAVGIACGLLAHRIRSALFLPGVVIVAFVMSARHPATSGFRGKTGRLTGSPSADAAFRCGLLIKP